MEEIAEETFIFGEWCERWIQMSLKQFILAYEAFLLKWIHQKQQEASFIHKHKQFQAQDKQDERGEY